MRPIWNGAIAFGLVSAPVSMYSATAEQDVHFHLVHEPDAGRIGYQKVCKAEHDRPVPAEEVVRAFERDDGKLVLLTDEDLAAADPGGGHRMEVLDFVPHEEIDPVYFERTYYLGPREGGEKVYALLTRAMERSGLAAVARYVFHDRENLGILRVRDGVITLEKAFFADEVRPHAGLRPAAADAVDDRELELAEQLIAAYRTGFDPGRYHDRHRERVLAIVEEKARTGAVAARTEQEPEAPPDLMAALRASLRAADRRGQGPPPGRGAGRSASGAPDLDGLTVAELRERARRADIRGRSRMGRRELVRALAAA